MINSTESIQPSAQVIELTNMEPHMGNGQHILSGSIDAIQRVKIKLSVRVGEIAMCVGEMLDMKEEQVIRLDTLADAPVDVLLEGHVVARGQLVAVDDNFGVRITELPKVKR
jgi:flagellar motor switch protein FliN/FliY